MNTVKTAPNKANDKKTVKMETVKKSTTTVDDVLQPTAESRLKKLETFKILATKHKHLVGKSDDLQNFIASSDGMKEKVILKNSQGFEFEVSNSSVIGKIIDVMETELTEITRISEKQVLEFSI